MGISALTGFWNMVKLGYNFENKKMKKENIKKILLAFALSIVAIGGGLGGGFLFGDRIALEMPWQRPNLGEIKQQVPAPVDKSNINTGKQASVTEASKDNVILPNVVDIKMHEANFQSSIKNIFQAFAEVNNAEVIETKDGGMWWNTEDGFSILSSIGTQDVNLFASNCSSDSEQLNFKSTVLFLLPLIDQVMRENGFRLSEWNSSKIKDDGIVLNDSGKDENFYDFIRAYENDSQKVVFSADPDCYSNTTSSNGMAYRFSFSVLDSKIYTKNYNKQFPYLKDLGIKEMAINEFLSETSNFIALKVHGRRYGDVMIAKKINKVWTKIASIQEAPDCELVKKYEIPKEIISDCYVGDKLVKNDKF